MVAPWPSSGSAGPSTTCANSLGVCHMHAAAFQGLFVRTCRCKASLLQSRQQCFGPFLILEMICIPITAHSAAVRLAGECCLGYAPQQRDRRLNQSSTGTAARSPSSRTSSSSATCQRRSFIVHASSKGQPAGAPAPKEVSGSTKGGLIANDLTLSRARTRLSYIHRRWSTSSGRVRKQTDVHHLFV